MDLPVMPPVKPMLAKAVDAVPPQPDGGDPAWSYEPKWDGFRCIVFRDGDEVVLGSRNERALTRYFPEVVAAAVAELPPRCVLDGELVVPRERDGAGRLDWEALSQRIHPADSRVRMLSEATPAHFVAFDVLALGSESLMATPFAQRRAAMERALAGVGPSFHLTAVTGDVDTATDWFSRFEGAGLDGVVAKPLDVHYRPDERLMRKVKHHRSADCVVIGYRRHKSIDGVGSMLLGLYREPAEANEHPEWGDAEPWSSWTRPDGARLHMIGGIGAFTTVRRRELIAELDVYRLGEGITAAGEANRWNRREDHSWVPLRPELVVEIAYDQMEGDRLRHAGRFLRWRPDREPASCTYDQLDVPVRYDLAEVLAT